MTWWEETVQIFHKKKKRLSNILSGFWNQCQATCFLWFRNVCKLSLSSLVWDQRQNSPCDIYSMTRKKLQKSSPKPVPMRLPSCFAQPRRSFMWYGWARCQCQTFSSPSLSGDASSQFPSEEYKSHCHVLGLLSYCKEAAQKERISVGSGSCSPSSSQSNLNRGDLGQI